MYSAVICWIGWNGCGMGFHNHQSVLTESLTNASYFHPFSLIKKLQLKLSESYSPFVGWFRECEIRHGRTAMLAVMGFIATDFIRIPGEMYSFEAIPKTIDAHDALLKSGPMYQLVLWIGLWDLLITAPAVQAIGEGEREPGDYAWYWFAPEDEAGLAEKKKAELLNGRLAMIAVGGIATQSIVTGHGFPYV